MAGRVRDLGWDSGIPISRIKMLKLQHKYDHPFYNLNNTDPSQYLIFNLLNLNSNWWHFKTVFLFFAECFTCCHYEVVVNKLIWLHEDVSRKWWPMSSVYVVCWIFLQTFQTYFCIQANSVDPNQTAPPKGAVWSGSTLFAKMTFKITSRWQSRRQ